MPLNQSYPVRPEAQKPAIGGGRLGDFKQKTKGGFKGKQSPRAMALQNRMKQLSGGMK